MAKFCEVCQQSYPDEHPSCPYCAVRAGHEATEDPTPGSPSGVDLGRRPHEGGGPISSMSGISAVDWSSPPGGSQSGGPGGTGESSVDLGGGKPIYPESGVSDVAWAALADEGAPDTGSEAAVFDSPSDADLRARGIPGTQLPESASALSGSGSDSGKRKDGSSSDVSLSREESSVDLGREALSEESDVSLDESLGLEMPVHQPLSEGGSGRDLIAEEVESGVNLAPPAPEEPPADTSAVGHAPAEPAATGSAVDLGSGDVDLPASKDLGAAAPYRAPLGSDDVIDLEGLPTAPSPSGLSVPETSPSAVDLGSHYDMMLDDTSGQDSQVVAAKGGEEGIDLGEAEDVRVGAHESGIDLGEPEAGEEEGMDLGEVESAEEAGMDLGEVDAGEEAGIDLGDETEAETPSMRRTPAAGEGVDKTTEYDPSAMSVESAAAGSEEFIAYDESMGERTDVEEPVVDEAAGEEAAALLAHEAAEEEPAAIEEEHADEEEPAAPVSDRRRRRREPTRVPAGAVPVYPGHRAWLGAVGGLLLGVVGSFGLWLVGIWPDSLRSSSSTAGVQPPIVQPQTPQTQTQQQAAVPPADAVAQRRRLLRQGDLDEARKAGIEQIQESDPKQLAERGEFRWLSYLQKQHQAHQKLRADDPAVVAAKSDLAKAAETKNPDALFWLGHIDEMTNQTAQAQKTYQRGIEEFKDDPQQQRRFQAALDRLQLRGAAGAAGAMRSAPVDGIHVLVAAVLGVALQPPAAAPEKPAPKSRTSGAGKGKEKPSSEPAPQAEEPAAADAEAGGEFWKADRLAREQDYSAALKSLERARQIHDERRFLNLRRAQNPLTDPDESIFLRCCDELRAYWEMQERLQKGGYLARGGDPVRAIEDLTQKAAGGGKLAQAAAERLMKDKVITAPEELDKGVEQLLSERKDALAKTEQLAKGLKASQQQAQQLEEKLKDTEATRDQKLREAEQREATLQESLAAEQKTVQAIASDLKEGKWLDAKAGKAGLRPALATVLKLAATVDPQGRMHALEDRVNRDEVELAQRWKPQEMLVLWLPILDDERGRLDLAERALRDADRVQSDEKSSAADRARAEVIRGLALRNQGHLADAKAALKRGANGLTGDRTPFAERAEAALKESSESGSALAQRARKLQQEGKPSEAVAALNQALESAPADAQAALLAERSQIELDAARAKHSGTLSPTDPLVVAAHRDAADAAKAGLAEGFYAAGRVAEELGRTNEATENYRRAVAAHPAVDAAGGRYRMALARVLLRPREAARPGWAAPPPEPEKTSRLNIPADSARKAEARQLAVLLAVALQAPAPPAPGSSQEEAQKLADEVLKAPEGTVPFNVRAQAYAVKGLWTRALMTYAEGLRGMLPPAYADELLDLVQHHPRLAVP